MADAVNPRTVLCTAWVRPIASASVVSVAALAACLATAAEILPDPTRPPAVMTAPVPVPDELTKTLVLQSVLIAKGRPSSAIISGQLFSVGDMVGAARLTQLTETRAVLKGPDGETILYLTPGVEKRSGTATIPRMPEPSGTGKNEVRPTR